MARSLWNDDDRFEILNRVSRVAADAPRQWGTMTSDQMLWHLTQAMRMPLGEVRPAPVGLPIRYTPLKELVIYVLPFAKGMPTAPELRIDRPVDVEATRDELLGLIDRFTRLPVDGPWPSHPAFGKMTGRHWGVLCWRHADHHLRQFGA